MNADRLSPVLARYLGGARLAEVLNPTARTAEEYPKVQKQRVHAMQKKGTPSIDRTRCTGCGRCIAVCAPAVLAFETVAWKKTSVLQSTDQCTGCRKCETACPVGAIQMEQLSVN